SEHDRLLRLLPGGPWQRARVLPFALSNRPGTATWFATGDPALAGLREPNPALRHFAGWRVEERQTVRVETLDRLTEQGDIGAPLALLKVDVQGGEYEVLLGAQQLLRSVSACCLTCRVRRCDPG